MNLMSTIWPFVALVFLILLIYVIYRIIKKKSYEISGFGMNL